MRRFKQIKRKEVIFDLDEWKTVEERAADLAMTTSDYIRRMAVKGVVRKIEMTTVAPVIQAMKSIGNNINQLARKANEINSIYADDVENLRKESDAIFVSIPKTSSYCKTVHESGTIAYVRPFPGFFKWNTNRNPNGTQFK